MVDVLAEAEKELLKIPGVLGAYVRIEFCLHRANPANVSASQEVEYIQGVEAIAKSVLEVLGTDRGVLLASSLEGGGASPPCGWTRLGDFLKDAKEKEG